MAIRIIIDNHEFAKAATHLAEAGVMFLVEPETKAETVSALKRLTHQPQPDAAERPFVINDAQVEVIRPQGKRRWGWSRQQERGTRWSDRTDREGMLVETVLSQVAQQPGIRSLDVARKLELKPTSVAAALTYAFKQGKVTREGHPQQGGYRYFPATEVTSSVA